MQRGRHANRTQIGCAVRSGLDLVQLGKRCDLSQMTDPTRVHDCGPDVIDELLLNELMAIVDRVEDFADRDGRRRVLPDQSERFLGLGFRWILEQEEMVGRWIFSEAGALVRRLTMVRVVEQERLRTEIHAQKLSEYWHEFVI